MRLVCPNCEAKYEVPEDAIPETGRDVQCANCGHAWYQMRPRAAASEAPAAATAAPEPEPVVSAAEVPVEAEPQPAASVPEPEEAPAVAEAVAVEDAPSTVEPEPVDATVPVGEVPAVAEAVPAEDAAVAPVAETVSEPVDPTPVLAETMPGDAGIAPAVAETAPAPADADAPAHAEDEVASAVPAAALGAAGAAAYAVDDSVLAILREEAEREAQARRAEAAKPLETQTELGIEQAMPEVSLPHQPVYEEAGLAARRARLPDVEEINSTLRPAETAADDIATDGMPVAVEGRSSFRSGFLLVLTVAILGAAVYGSADAIADAVPALAGMLKGYVGFVDSLRLQLDGMMQSATVALNGT